MAALRVGGLTRWTSIDFPGRLAAVVFCQGCPWRCGYCHNPGLLDAARPGALDWPAVLDFLRRRRGLLDGVAFSGGEPLAQSALPQALAQVRALGFATALHTGGMYPQRLAAALPLLDWVGLDIKALPRHYDAITRTPGSGARAWQSLQRLLDGATAFECRTTWHPALFDAAALRALATRLADLGVRHWALQRCTLPGLPPWRGDAQAVLQGVQERFARFELRGD
ncbi:pyruvate formate lyase activating enzyme [Oryzisolibacter propanilivorax]|uniref:Pyruvate formate lyase activating enzyme n=1 Tax=Oryzisolibacter propanilivorax TaxID=1527607 RepID=A0A1G9QIP2_9BURK|nr:anaerobic ribonucleoside-triphosphate reductase activating protein [Oryzisolibacter propanilivorax]SDM10661.1 pyruvate formate lyase activating enzyme [Oryzisolibacter propanilivorax]